MAAGRQDFTCHPCQPLANRQRFFLLSFSLKHFKSAREIMM